MRRLALVLLGIAALVLAFGRPVLWTEAALIVWDVAAGGEQTLWQHLTDRPSDRAVRWFDGEGDLYTPATTARAAMVLVPGAAVLGRDEPRLQALARTLARAGFVVLVPELPEVRRLALSCADADRVSAALQDDLAFVVGIGGYHDSEAAIRFVTTGAFRPLGDAREFRVTPNNYGRWAFLRANADRLDDAGDAFILQTIAHTRFQQPDADVLPLAAKLGPDGRAVLALVENRDPDTVTRLVAALPEKVRREIDGLNLALHDLSRLHGHLILVHGRGDRLVPYSESQVLAAAASNARVSLFLVDDIGHVDFNAVTAANGWKLWSAVATLLGERR
ncbi:hypothetical protein [Reyranella sp.]|uniref:hypothetical protein n=1 Tax=Reyranella sp. TaxID=1929291 RepID=UPI003D0B524A